MNRTEYLLTCLMEECAEIQQAASKALRFGLGSQYCPELDCNYDNSEALRKELTDLDGIRELLYENRILCPPFPPGHEEAVIQKKRKVEKTYQRHIKVVDKCVECGTPLHQCDKIPGYGILECSSCGHPNSI